MRALYLLLLLSILPLSELKANESIDTIQTAYKLFLETEYKGLPKSYSYFRSVIHRNDNKDLNVVAFCQLQLATLKLYTREIDSCYYYLKNAKQVLENTKNPKIEIVSHQLSLEMTLSYHLRKYKETILLADSGFYYQELLPKKDSSILISCCYLKAASLYMMEDYNAAIELAEKSFSYIANKNGNMNWRLSTIHSLLGNCYKRKGYSEKGLEHLYKSLEYFYPQNPNELVVSLLHSIGQLHASLGEFELAKNNFRIAISKLDKLFHNDHFRYTFYYNSLAESYLNLNNADSALIYYQKALNNAIRFNPNSLWTNYRSIAVCYDLLDSTLKAEKNFELAISKANLDFKEYSFSKGRTLLAASKFFIDNKQYKRGKELLNNTYSIFTKDIGNKNNKYLSECYIEYSKIAKAQGDFTRSLEYLNKGLQVNKYNLTDSVLSVELEFDNIYSKQTHLDLLIHKANILDSLALNGKTKNKKTSLKSRRLQHLITASKLAQKIRISFYNEEGKYRHIRSTKQIFKSIIQEAFLLYNLTNDKQYIKLAFEASENSKAGLLSELINVDRLQKTSTLPDSINHKLDHLNADIRLTRKKINTLQESKSMDPIELDNLNDNLFRITKLRDVYINYIDENFDDFYRAKLDSKPLKLEHIMGSLSKDKVIIEYYLFENVLFSFLIESNTISVHKTLIDESFYTKLEELLAYTKDPLKYHTNEDYIQYITNSKSLYDLLIKPLEYKIRDKELTIIPDDVLLNLPFEILIRAESNNEMNSNHPNYLLFSNPISYAYSSNLLNINLEKVSTEVSKVIAFAPSYRNESNDSTFQKSYLDLPFALEEIKSIKSYVKTEIHSNNNASKNEFIKHSKEPKIFHLAMHAELNNSKPDFSSLVFTPISDSEHKLYTTEISALDMNAPLVVLSACNTGSGEIRKGEGVMSFARAFLMAGCPSLCLTLWSINDQASADLMQSYYQYLSEGNTKSKALQQAKIEYLKTADPLKSHPYYWAAFIQLGNDDPIQFKSKKNNSLILIIASITLLFSSLGVILHKKRRA